VTPGDAARERSRFLRRLVVGMVVFFGLGTIVSNVLSLLATESARASLGPIPYPLFWFELALGWAYLGLGFGIAWRKRWALRGAWGVAVVHAVSATLLWLWYFAGHPIARATLVMELLREGFWVLMGLYLWHTVAPPLPPAARPSISPKD
jgi:hypothetical protein